MNNVEKYTKNINILSQSVESTENVYLISEPKIKPKILLHLDPELTITLDPLSFKHFLKKYENQPILDKVYLFQQFREELINLEMIKIPDELKDEIEIKHSIFQWVDLIMTCHFFNTLAKNQNPQKPAF